MNYNSARQRLLLSVALLVCCAFGTLQVSAQQLKRYVNLQEALFSQGRLSGSNGPASVNWTEGGKAFSYLKNIPQERKQEIRLFNPATGADELVFDGAGLTFPGTDASFTYQSFAWSEDAAYLLFQSNFRPVWRNSGASDYYFYNRTTKALQLVAKDARTAQLSPDGKMVAYEREGNLFLYRFADGTETQLTYDAAPELYNGRFGWAYEEEFGLAQAWEWSPDSRYIAFWQSDEREVPVFQMTDYAGKHPEYVQIRYPKVGDKNPLVKIGVIDVQQQTKKWVDLDLQDGYIPRIYWTSDPGKLALVHLNRKQNHLQLFFFTFANSSLAKIMEEKSEAWIDVFDFFAGILHYFFFPEQLKEFFWISERNGRNHIYRFNYEGKLLGQVTQGNWDVTYLHQIDAKNKTIYYTSTEASPLERHLYSIRFDGKQKKQLTRVPGNHTINFSPASNYYIDRYSNISTPTQVELWSVKGELVKKLEENQGVKQTLQERAYAPKELMQFTTTDGQPLDLYVIKPMDFDPAKKYPLVLNIYGGPGAQSVYNTFATNGWEQYLAQTGYVVVSVNNRGSGGYGADFKKKVYGKLGEWESHDFVETARYMATMPWVDGNRMAIRGHSYGGYMASMTMLRHPGVFKVALVGAPVTDWRLYDSIYAERYMGLFEENDANYTTSSVTHYAPNLQGKMLIAHSSMDENVHVQNTYQLVKALIDRGKDVDLRIYPPGAHGVAYDPVSYVLLYQQYTDYLQTHMP